MDDETMETPPDLTIEQAATVLVYEHLKNKRHVVGAQAKVVVDTGPTGEFLVTILMKVQRKDEVMQ